MPAFQPDPIDDRTPLMLAACENDLVGLFEHLLDTVEIDAQDSRKWTALTYAASLGHYEIVTQLLDSGADPNIHASYDMVHTPLSIAAAGGHFDTVRLLIAHGADPDCYAGIWAARAECYARHNSNHAISEFLLYHEDEAKQR